MKKIALVHDFLYTYGGAERVLQELHKLYPEAPIYTAFAKKEVIERHFPDATIVTSSLQRSLFRYHPAAVILKMPRAIEEFNFSAYDTVISSSGAFSHGIITGPDTRHICYCHSPMRYVWDWHREFLIERGIPAKSFLNYLAEATVFSNLRIWDQVTAKRVDVWLANSKTVQDRIRKFYHQEAEIVYPPINTTYFDPQKVREPSSSKPFLFTASRLTATKHIDWIIEAAEACSLSLLIAGEGKERSTLEALAASKKADVQFLGFISEEKKRSLLAQALAFIFPVEDDFGIAPVEALAMGTPVIAYGKGGVTETVQNNKSGLFFTDPTSAGLIKAIITFQKEGISYTREQIRESALPFSTEAFAQHIQNIVDHA